jgi:hypothetical protein
MLEFQVAVVVGTALFLIVGLSPSTSRGRRPMYNTVGLDRHRTAGTHRPRTTARAEMAAPRGAAWGRPAAGCADSPTAAEARADERGGGFVGGPRH